MDLGAVDYFCSGRMKKIVRSSCSGLTHPIGRNQRLIRCSARRIRSLQPSVGISYGNACRLRSIYNRSIILGASGMSVCIQSASGPLAYLSGNQCTICDELRDSRIRSYCSRSSRRYSRLHCVNVRLQCCIIICPRLRFAYNHGSCVGVVVR